MYVHYVYEMCPILIAFIFQSMLCTKLNFYTLNKYTPQMVSKNCKGVQIWIVCITEAYTEYCNITYTIVLSKIEIHVRKTEGLLHILIILALQYIHNYTIQTDRRGHLYNFWINLLTAEKGITYSKWLKFVKELNRTLITQNTLGAIDSSTALLLYCSQWSLSPPAKQVMYWLE